ncbi:uncharacterized protein PHALS_02222 [Plasmopara halstedii]|uniref:Uncharacterized protein n=1 Tax=Plasmopara halstedii TaxID=4781 RepID=A0A0N7L3M8_PLAHL|nr:uncharacterized protein PHALS_02222 [Plasmopara halstedii]CEG36315.1 hypothetical protein PHALS_02222 [Plasmopara halstedii]|eukprot:XP_024572684.1 hypothetical protein PHALS_02222 [Plasmopara halstedii]
MCASSQVKDWDPDTSFVGVDATDGSSPCRKNSLFSRIRFISPMYSPFGDFTNHNLFHVASSTMVYVNRTLLVIVKKTHVM